MPEFQHTRLANELRCATAYLPERSSVALAIAVDTGARYELPEQQGISHLLEHMAFKGTKRRSAQDIAIAFDRIGGQLNAYTSAEQTVYYARLLSDQLPLAIDIMADIMQHSTFAADELAREQGVILQEIAMHYDTPDDLVFDMYHAAAYPDQPLGRSILGTPEHVSGYNADDIHRYMGSHYHTPNMTLTASGNVNHAELTQLVTEHFTDLPNNFAAKPEPGTYQGGEDRQARSLEQLHVMLGVEAIDIYDDDYTALQLLSLIFGGGMSSRLFQEVREKRGLVYSVYSFLSCYRDTGTLGIYAATSEDYAPELLDVLCNELCSLADGVTAEELERVQNQQIAHLLMAEESPSNLAEWMGRHLHNFGEIRTAETLIRKIRAQTPADLQRVAKRLLNTPVPTLAALGPTGSLASYDTVKQRLGC